MFVSPLLAAILPFHVMPSRLLTLWSFLFFPFSLSQTVIGLYSANYDKMIRKKSHADFVTHLRTLHVETQKAFAWQRGLVECTVDNACRELKDPLGPGLVRPIVRSNGLLRSTYRADFSPPMRFRMSSSRIRNLLPSDLSSSST